MAGLRAASTAAATASAPAAARACLETGLDLERIDPDLFLARRRNLWLPPAARAVFGGQVVGQALRAATFTVGDGADEDPRAVNSVHSYFLAPGRPDRDIVYRVMRTRDGKSFSSRSVIATQDAVPIFQAMISFHSREDSAVVLPDHQATMPAGVPDPESLPSLRARWSEVMADPRMPAAFRDVISTAISSPFPLDVRHVDPRDPFDPQPLPEARQLMWIKSKETIGEDAHMHRCVASFASDWHLCTTPLLSSRLSFPSTKIKAIASVDHSLWFFDDFRSDEWMLYEMDCPRSGNGLGVNFGRLYRRDGILAATVAQEALIRTTRGASERK
jgi:acyl-CoA thioesterase II